MRRKILVSSTFVVASLIYFFSICLWTTISTVGKVINRWTQYSELTVYLNQDVNPTEIQQLRQFFQEIGSSIKADYKSSKEIQDELQQLMPNSNLDFSGQDELVAAIPPHFVVKANQTLVGSTLQSLFTTMSTDLQNFSFVESTSYGQSWVKKYLKTFQSVQNSMWSIILGLSLTLLLAFGNSIRSHIHSQRETIEIMELVGATPGMIRKPFLMEGAILSLSAMTFCLILQFILVLLINHSELGVIKVLNLNTNLSPLNFQEWVVSEFVALLIGLLSSHLCLMEINTGWSASLNRGESLK